MHRHTKKRTSETLVQLHSLLGRLTDKQCELYMLIRDRTSRDLWTDYETARQNGIAAAAKRMQELLKVDGVEMIRQKSKNRVVRWKLKTKD